MADDAAESSEGAGRGERTRSKPGGTSSDNSAAMGTNDERPEEEEEEETEDEYRLRVYGTSDASSASAPNRPVRRRRSGSSRKAARATSSNCDGDDATTSRTSLLRRSSSSAVLLRDASRRLSRQLSRRRSSLVESLPDTPQGWVTLVTAAASTFLAYELRLQKSLTCPPLVFCQSTPYNSELKRRLSTPTDKGILSRNISPSLLVGTRGRVASIAAYAVPHRNDEEDDGRRNDVRGGPQYPSRRDDGGPPPSATLRFREIFHMGADGAEIAVDWEVPPEPPESTGRYPYKSASQRRDEILRGPISRPVVVILHGINNDASFGYIRSLMRACTDRGWIAAGFNFRGCGGVPLRTPRGYTGAYTGDLRYTVRSIAERTVDDTVPLFVVGNSLGANLITKYLGEEGKSGTLPPNVAGGVSLGNPLEIHSGNMSFPWAELLGVGVKKMILMQWKVFRQITDKHHWNAIMKALFARTIGQLDCALAPHMIRNSPDSPFEVRVGYEDGEAYWDDASSYKYVQFVDVPLLKITAQDDFLVYGPSLRKMSHCLENPNVFVVKTKCGGHLGWQEAPPDTGNVWGFGTSWADTATTEFIGAVIQLRKEKLAAEKNMNAKEEDGGAYYNNKNVPDENQLLSESQNEITAIRSRL